jgi:hypothetical protein
VTVAASVFALVVLGSGGWAYLARLEAVRRAATEQRVTQALDEATLLWGQARSATEGDLSKWSEALSAAKRAEGLLAGGGADAAIHTRAQAVLTGLKKEQAAARARAAEAERERALLSRLEAIRANRSEHWDPKQTDREYASAFREFGLDLDQLDPQEVGKRLAAWPASVELATFLDDWASVRRDPRAKLDEGSWQRLVAAARAVDPDPWRDALRVQIGRKDQAVLRRLADDVKALEGQAAPSLVLMAMTLSKAGDRGRAAAVLERAWRLRPDDFWVNYESGRAH